MKKTFKMLGIGILLITLLVGCGQKGSDKPQTLTIYSGLMQDHMIKDVDPRPFYACLDGLQKKLENKKGNPCSATYRPKVRLTLQVFLRSS